MRMKTGFKWALYYAVHLLANGAAVLLFRQYLNISWFSLFPVIYMVTFYMQVRYPFYQRRQRMMRGEEDRTIAGYAHIEKDKDGKVQAWGRRYVYKDGKSPDEDMGLVYMVAPFCLPFILFFSPLVKVLSIFFLLLVPIVYVVALIIKAKVKGELPPPAESAKAKQERELKEQQQREELGRWK